MPIGSGRLGKVNGGVLLGLPLLVAVIVMAGRVGGTARFVTWPIVTFTVLAAAVALVGVWVGLERPGLLAAGVFPGLILAYVLPAAPVAMVAGVLVGLAALAVGTRGLAAGTAMTVGAAMVLAVVLQGPAVECGKSSVSSNSGPWWMPSQSSSSGSGTGVPGGGFSGTTQVGDHRYTYDCAGGRLISFERAGGAVYLAQPDGRWTLKEAYDPLPEQELAEGAGPSPDWYAEYEAPPANSPRRVRLSGHAVDLDELAAQLRGFVLEPVKVNSSDGMAGTASDPIGPSAVAFDVPGDYAALVLSYELSVDDLLAWSDQLEIVAESEWTRAGRRVGR